MNQKEPRRSVAEYLYKRVADHIAGRIEHGELRPGDQLLSERELAEKWGTSHVTVRRAIRELRDRQRASRSLASAPSCWLSRSRKERLTVIDLVSDQTPPGWVRIPADIDGVPVWKRPDEPCYVATRDMDQLRFIGAALARFEEISGPEFHTFIQRNPVT